MALTSTWTAEEGTDGAAITTASSGAVAVSGSPLYAAAAKLHGAMGANLSGASAVVFTEPTTGGAGNGQSSTYVNLVTAGSTPTTAVGPKQASTFHARVRFNPANGKIDVTDGAGTTVQGTSATSYTLGQWVRIDIRRTYTSPNMTITVRLFFGANREGTVPDETLGPYTINVGTNATARDSIGPPVTGAVMYADTHRMYDDTTTWPAPFAAAGTTVSPPAAASSEAFGSATVSVGAPPAQTVNPSGMTSSEAFGAALVSSGAVFVSPSAVSSGEAVGTPAIATGPVSVAPLAIGSGEAVGTPGVTVIGGTVTPQLDVDFEDGTTGAFNTVQGATVGTAYAHDQTKGVRLAPDGSGFAALDYNIPSGQQTHPWAAFRGWWRPVVKTADAPGFNNNAVLLEIGNTLTSAPKGQLTIYTQNGDLGVDFNTSDFSAILPAFTTGAWHLIEIRVYFGATTFTAYVRIDGVEYVHTSAATQTPASVRALWMKYSNTVTDATDDFDGVRFWYGDFDPGYLAAPNLGQSVSPAGIASASAFGAATVVPPPQTLSPTGISTSEGEGVPTVTPGPVTTAPTGIGSAQAAGQPVITLGPVTASPAGVASGEAFGQAALNPGPVSIAPSGIGSLEAPGTPTVTLGPVTVSPPSITSPEVFGAPTVTPGPVTLAPAGIAGGETFGTPTAATGPITLTVPGIASLEAVGAPVVAPGAVTLTPVGVGSAEQLGAPVVRLSGALQVLAAAGIASAESFGLAAVTDREPTPDGDLVLSGTVAASPWAGTVARNPWAGTIGEA